ncbi:hypothetical protein P0F65_17320 [Sphingomonas sp. I4]
MDARTALAEAAARFTFSPPPGSMPNCCSPMRSGSSATRCCSI